MNFDLKKVTDDLSEFWSSFGTIVVVVVGLIALAAIGIALWRFWHSQQRSKGLSTFAAIVVMAWTSEGLLAVSLNTFKIPVGFASITFFVFEALMLAAGMKAEENRKENGEPGVIGRYVFLIGTCSGMVAAYGTHMVGLVFLRIALPPLSIGLWWLLLMSPRPDDKEEWKEAREKKRQEREATWAITPSTLLVKWGIKKPGKITTTDAQRKDQINRMVIAAEIIDDDGWRANRARKRLRKLTRTADAEMIQTVARQVRWTVDAETLMVPARQKKIGSSAIELLRAAGIEPASIDGRAVPDALPAAPAPLPEPAASGIGHSTPTPIGHLPEPPNGHRALSVGHSPSGVSDRASGTNGRALSIGHRAPLRVLDRAVPEPAASGIGHSETETSGSDDRAVPEADAGHLRDRWSPRVEVGAPRPTPTVPAQRTPEPKDPEAAELTPAEMSRAARERYRRSVEEGQPLSGAELARQFGKTDPKWGTRQIAAVRKETAEESAQDQEDQQR